MIPGAAPMKPTICPHCRYSNGGVFSVCPICKRAVLHPGDALNVIASVAILALVFTGVIA